MGCDIHMVVEAYSASDAKWHLVIAEPATYGDRNYTVFGALAGVRRDGPMIAAPRGLPEDISAEAKIWAEHDIDHTPSWVLLSEVLAFDWTQGLTMSGVVNAADVFSMLRRKSDVPLGWLGGVAGDKVKYVTLAELKRMILALGEIPEIDDAVEEHFQGLHHHFVEPLRHYYAEHSWAVPLERYCGDFLAWARGLVDPNGVTDLRWVSPESIRLVFGFDS